MPKIVDKVDCLNGHVVLYGSGTSSGKWLYREWDGVAKKYRQKQIPDASDVTEAVKGAIDIAFLIKQETESSRATLPSGKKIVVEKVSKRTKGKPRETIHHSVEQFLNAEYEKVDAGQLEYLTVQAKANVLRNHMLPYLTEQGVIFNDQITIETFQRYPIHRQETTPLNLQQELKRIKNCFTAYLIRKKLVDYVMVSDKQFLPNVRVTQMDRMKNPAINPDD